MVFPDQTYSGVSDGATAIATITEKNTVYTFKCVTAKDVHTWLLEGTNLYPKIRALETALSALDSRVTAIETALEAIVGE